MGQVRSSHDIVHGAHPLSATWPLNGFNNGADHKCNTVGIRPELRKMGFKARNLARAILFLASRPSFSLDQSQRSHLPARIPFLATADLDYQT
jgi:hypothetical protein